ncbi:hypothetical protein GCM10010455_18180 [Microbacterium esteraromaticum]
MAASAADSSGSGTESSDVRVLATADVLAFAAEAPPQSNAVTQVMPNATRKAERIGARPARALTEDSSMDLRAEMCAKTMGIAAHYCSGNSQARKIYAGNFRLGAARPRS